MHRARLVINRFRKNGMRLAGDGGISHGRLPIENVYSALQYAASIGSKRDIRRDSRAIDCGSGRDGQAVLTYAACRDALKVGFGGRGRAATWPATLPATTSLSGALRPPI